MLKHKFLILIVMTVFISACGASYKAESPIISDNYGGGMAEDMDFEMEAAAAPVGSGESFQSASTGGEVTIQRMVIKNAQLSIVVIEPAVAMDEIMTMAEAMGGFVVNSSLEQTTLDSGVTVDQASITIRVPAERLDEALTQIKAGAGEVRSEYISGEDVTSKYTDLQSRLRNLESAEAQLNEIMEEAHKTEDVLQVYNNLVNVREQIEVIKGQMQYYEQAAALSSISIEIIADEADQPIQIGGWQPVGVAKNAIEALINFLKGFVNFLIWLIIFLLPVAIVIGVPLTFAWRGLRSWRRRRKERKQAKAAKNETE